MGAHKVDRDANMAVPPAAAEEFVIMRSVMERYLIFWIAFANYAAYGIVKIVVLAALLIHCGALACRRRLASCRGLAEPLLYATLFAVIVITLGFSTASSAILRKPRRTGSATRFRSTTSFRGSSPKG
jgi:hypothetical protein